MLACFAGCCSLVGFRAPCSWKHLWTATCFLFQSSESFWNQMVMSRSKDPNFMVFAVLSACKPQKTWKHITTNICPLEKFITSMNGFMTVMQPTIRVTNHEHTQKTLLFTRLCAVAEKHCITRRLFAGRFYCRDFRENHYMLKIRGSNREKPHASTVCFSPSFLYTFTSLFLHFFIPSLLYSFTSLFLHSFTHSLIPSFSYLVSQSLTH